MSKLLNRTLITIYRNETGNNGYLDSDGRWVENPEQQLQIRGSLQPYRNGDSQKDLPEGIRSDQVYVVYTKSPILAADDRRERQADQIEIDGVRFEAFFVENWNHYNLSIDHYKGVFIKKDKLNSQGV